MKSFDYEEEDLYIPSNTSSPFVNVQIYLTLKVI